MSLKEAYPDLTNFLICYFSDPVNDDDVKLTQEFLAENSQELISSVISQGKEILEMKPFPWNEVSMLANRCFVDMTDAHEWLFEIVATIESAG